MAGMGFALVLPGWALRFCTEYVLPGWALWFCSEHVPPARRQGVSACPCRRTRQGADARPLTIPASGSLCAPRCGVPSSRPAADGPSGLAIPGSCRPLADVLSAHPGLRLFLSAPDASPTPPPLISSFLLNGASSAGLKAKAVSLTHRDKKAR